MSQSKEVIEKAIHNSAMLTQDNGGQLQPALADGFVDYVINESILPQMARTIKFRNKEYDIDEVTLGRRVAMAKSEATDPQKRRSVGFDKIKIEPEWITLPFEITHEFMRENKIGMSVDDRIMQLMGTQLGNDIAEFAMISNKLGPAGKRSDLFPGYTGDGYIKDGFLALQDGWSTLAEGGHVLDALDANISKDIFSEALQTLPEKYQRDAKAMKFILAMNLEHKYNNRIANREDSAGVGALAGGMASSFGYSRLPIALWTTTPLVVEHMTMTGVVPQQLANAPISSIVAVTTSTLGVDVPETPLLETTDYTVNLTLGQITRVALGAITDGQVVKVTYRAQPQMLLTNINNLIVGVDPEGIRVLRDTDIYADKVQFAMHVKVGLKIQNLDAVVKVKNIGLG